MGKDKYMCQLCQNHGIFDVPKKGHKQLCPYKNCGCPSCSLNAKRRELDQIERQLRKDDPSNIDTALGQAPIDSTPQTLFSNSYPHMHHMHIPVTTVAREFSSSFQLTKNRMAAPFDFVYSGGSPKSPMMNSPVCVSNGNHSQSSRREHYTKTSISTGLLPDPKPMTHENRTGLSVLGAISLLPKHAMLPIVPECSPMAIQTCSTTHSSSNLRYAPYPVPVSNGHRSHIKTAEDLVQEWAQRVAFTKTTPAHLQSLRRASVCLERGTFPGSFQEPNNIHPKPGQDASSMEHRPTSSSKQPNGGPASAGEADLSTVLKLKVLGGGSVERSRGGTPFHEVRGLHKSPSEEQASPSYKHPSIFRSVEQMAEGHA